MHSECTQNDLKTPQQSMISAQTPNTTPAPPPRTPCCQSTVVRILRMRQPSQQTGKFGLPIGRRHVRQFLPK